MSQCLTPNQSVGHGNLVMRSKPYRNDRIISVIRDMYFSGGRLSFATRYNYLFQSTEDDNTTVSKVPIPMVALAATAVRFYVCVYPSVLMRVGY
jgi:Domain of unknown function (DUF6532)